MAICYSSPLYSAVIGVFSFFKNIVKDIRQTVVYCDVCALKCTHIVFIKIIDEDEENEEFSHQGRYCDHCLKDIKTIIRKGHY